MTDIYGADLEMDLGAGTIVIVPSENSPVTSVNGRTGTVVLNASDVGAVSTVNEEIKTKIEYVSGSVTLKDGIMVQQTPTENNEPASKKYVDDAIAALRAELA